MLSIIKTGIKKIICAMALPTVLLALSVQPAPAQQPTERVLVVFKPGAAAVQRQARSADMRVVRQFRTLPGIAAEVTAAGLETLRQNPDVLAVAPDMPVQAAVDPNITFIKADAVPQVFGVTGAGVNVAVLDSGIDVSHPALAGSIVAQQCFNKNNTCPPNDTAQSDSGQDENGHGTHVAGIVHSVAPGAGLVAVRVLDANGSGYTSDVLAGIDWVLANRQQYHLGVINLSLGGGSYPDVCDSTDANTLLYAAAVEAANQAGVSLFAAAGNNGQAEALMLPACVGGVLAVGNVYHAALGSAQWPVCTETNVQPGQVACSSNSSPALDLLAPGTLISSTWLGGGTKVESGTSMATPHAAAVAALLLQADPSLLPAEIESALKSSGAPTTDSRNGRVSPRLDALAAVSAAIGALPVAGQVWLQGRTDFSGVEILTSAQPCDAPEFSATAVTNTQGGFEFLAAGPVGCLRAAKPGFLLAQISAPAGDIGSVLLPAGDLSGDGAINILDLVQAANSFNTNDPVADIDISGTVDILDLVLIAQNFKLTGPIIWPLAP